jgi:hypothetical protein
MFGLLLAAALSTIFANSFCIVAAEEQGTGVVILKPDGKLVARVEVGRWPHEVEVSSDGTTAFVSQFGITDYDSRIGTPGDHVSRIDLATARETGRFMLPDGLRAPHGIKLRPGSAELFVNAEAGGDTMLVHDSVSGRLLRSFPLTSGSHNFVFSPDGRFVFVFAGIEGVQKYDAFTGRQLATRKLATPVRGLRLAGAEVIAAAGKGEVTLLDTGTLALKARLPSPIAGQLVYLEALPDGAIIAPSIADNGVGWFAPGGGSRFIRTGKGALGVRLAPNGRLYVANVDDDHLTVLSSSGHVLGQIGHGIQGPNGLAFGVCPLPKR